MLLGVEFPLSMDEVLRKCYHGKLEHWEANLVKILPSPHWIDQFALTAASPTSPTTGGGLSSEADPLSAHPISSVMSLGGVRPSSAESSEDNKEGIILDARCMQAKREVMMAMGEPATGVSNVAKRVQTRRDFSCLLNSITSAPSGVVVIPDDDNQ